MVKEGRICADGDKGELLTDSKVSELYGESIKVESQNGIHRMRLADDVIQ